jgi:predicted AlkP superfamily phosphohydrolase/phosphomutase
VSARVLFIGIDALDSEMIRRFEADLPNIARIRRTGIERAVEPIHPPDSDTAWATIVTGLDPSEHGIVKYDDPLEKSGRLSSADPDNTALRGRTFWDAASRAGRRVCVLFPHLGYPVWPVNGVMVGRSGFHPQPMVYPEGLPLPGWDLAALNVVGGMPDRGKARYIRANRDLLEGQTRFALDLLDREHWDLFFAYSSVLDMIQHYFWSACDPGDPAWPGPNPHQDVIRDFYRHQDDIIGRLIAGAGEGAAVFVVSDHGHGMRPTRVFNLNEHLRRGGLLTLDERVGRRAAANLLERSKAAAAGAVGRFGLGTDASRILRRFPFLRRMYARPISVDWSRTRAYATNLSGIKAYSYGGIMVPRGQNPGAGYEETREKIISDLNSVLAEDGKPVFQWVRRREELFHGVHLEKYPDILFEMRYGIASIPMGSPARGTVSWCSSGKISRHPFRNEIWHGRRFGSRRGLVWGKPIPSDRPRVPSGGYSGLPSPRINAARPPFDLITPGILHGFTFFRDPPSREHG